MKKDRYTVSSEEGKVVIDLPENMELYALGGDILRRFKAAEDTPPCWQILVFGYGRGEQIWTECSAPLGGEVSCLERLKPDAPAPENDKEYVVTDDKTIGGRDVVARVVFRVPPYMKVFTSRNHSGVIRVWRDKAGVYRRYRIEGGPEVWQQMNWPAENVEVSWEDCPKPGGTLMQEKPVEAPFENGLYYQRLNGDFYRRVNGTWEVLSTDGDQPTFQSLDPALSTDSYMRSRGVKKVDKAR